MTELGGFSLGVSGRKGCWLWNMGTMKDMGGLGMCIIVFRQADPNASWRKNKKAENNEKSRRWNKGMNGLVKV